MITRSEMEELDRLLCKPDWSDEDEARIEELDAKNRAGLVGVDDLLEVLADLQIGEDGDE